MTVTASEMRLDYAAMEAVKTATHVAIIRRHRQIEPLHLLAGLAAGEQGIAHQVLDQSGVTYSYVKNNVPLGQHGFEGNSRPPGEQFSMVVNAAKQMALDLSSSHVHTEHLLLALLENQDVRTFLEMRRLNPLFLHHEAYSRTLYAALNNAVPGLQQSRAHLQTALAVLARWTPNNGPGPRIQIILDHVDAASTALEPLVDP